MKAKKENLIHRKWYMIDDNVRCILQYNEVNPDKCIGY